MKLSMVSTWAGVSLCAASLLACESQADRKAEAVQEAQKDQQEEIRDTQHDQAELARDQAEQRADNAQDHAQEAQKVRGEDTEDRQDVAKDNSEENMNMAKYQAEDRADQNEESQKHMIDANKDVQKAESEFEAARRKYVLDARERLGEIQNRADGLNRTEDTAGTPKTAQANRLANIPTSARKISTDIDNLEKATASEFKSMRKMVDNELDKLEKMVKKAERND
jgi:hypothetical protein